jgi:hypothetical protein
MGRNLAAADPLSRKRQVGPRSMRDNGATSRVPVPQWHRGVNSSAPELHPPPAGPNLFRTAGGGARNGESACGTHCVREAANLLSGVRTYGCTEEEL